MGHRKASYIIVLFLLMGIWTNSVMGEACLCGQACPHILQSKLEAGVNSSFHMRCCGTNCNSCNIEKGQTLKAANTFTPTGSVKSFAAIYVISVFVDYPSTINVLKDFGVFAVVDHYHLLQFTCETSPYSVNPFVTIPDSTEDNSLSF